MAGDLSVTALYTSQVWVWGKLPNAELFATRDAKRVFDATNAALAVFGPRGWAPLRIALLQRHAMIDHLVADRTRIVELAAGLSRRGATFSERPAVHYVEIDLPDVIARKRALLAASEPGRAVLARANFELVGGDVATVELAHHAPQLVIAEGLLMYLDGPARRALFAKLAALGDVELVFDLVPADEEPAPGRFGKLLEAAMKRFTGGRSFERDARSRGQILDELRAAGFADVAAIAAYDVASAWQLPHASERANMVVFTARGSRSTRA